MLEDRVRRKARKYLPEAVRKPVGKLAGWFRDEVVRPIQGLLFDLRGGRFHADGCTFAIPKEQTSRAFRACFFDGSYELDERALICEFVRPTDTVLELGACLGVVSCITNKILADKTKHVVVEGNPFCIPTLNCNRELNQCGFVVENCAISNQPDVTFYLHPIYIVGGTTQRKSSRPVRVPARSLAELEARYGPFSALIIDIEGAELEIFAASREQLKHYRLVVVELHDWAIGADGVERCRQILNDAGLHFQKRAGITDVWERSA
jgi:FkbM family methyltransferase